MYPVSAAFQEAVKQPTRVWNCKVHIDTAIASYDFDDSDVQQGKITLKESACNSDAFSLGSAVAADCSVTLLNKNNRFSATQFNGGVMKVQIGLKVASGDYEYVPLGVFNIDEVSRPTSVVTIDSADNMLKLDQPFSGVSISYPISNKDLLVSICAYCGVDLHTTSFLNDGYIVTESPSGTPSCRDIVSAIAELAAAFARCTRDSGALELVQFMNPRCVTEADIDGNVDDADGGTFEWDTSKTYDGGTFTETPVVADLTTTERSKFSVDDDPLTITGVTFDGADQTYLVGSDFYAVHISDNPLIPEGADPTDLLNSIFDVLYDFNYLPFSSTWYGNPALQPGDIVLQTAKDGTAYRTITTSSTYVYRGNCSLEAAGVSKAASGYQSSSSRTVAQLKRTIHQKQVQIDAMKQAINSATSMIAGVWGGYVVDGDTLENTDYHGNIFICDNVGPDVAHPDVTQATKVWRWNLGGFGYSSTGINGPYLTAITADGQIVADVITANMIRTGILQALNGDSWFDLDNGTFSFANGSLVYSSANGLRANLSDGTYTQMTGSGVKATHTDGSYTTLDGGGLLHHNGSDSTEYHYLIWQTNVNFEHSEGTAVASIQLPDAFKGKNFVPFASLEGGWKNPDSEYYALQGIFVQALISDVENAIVDVYGNLGVVGMSTNTYHSFPEELHAILTVIA